MAAVINNPGVYHRLASHEAHDAAQSTRNILSDARKSWPNEAGFDHLDEHRGPLPLAVTGAIPDFAAGALYRTGPGQSRLEDLGARGRTHYVTHWFDGFAHTHKFDIVSHGKDSGKPVSVQYSSRRNSAAYVQQVRRKGWRSAITLGQRSDPCVGIFAKTMSVFQPLPRRELDYNVTVTADYPALSRRSHKEDSSSSSSAARNIFIGTDHSGLQELHPDTLEHVGYSGQNRLHPDLTGEMSCAHPQRDPETGDLFNSNLKVGPGATYRVFRTSAATGQTDILATIPAGRDAPPAYIHSMFLTARYAVLAIPATHLAWSGMKLVWMRNFVDAFVPFSEENKMLWFVIDRRHGKGVVARFSTPAGFFFHSINAFEETVTVTGAGEDGADEERVEIVADMSAYETLDIIYSFYYDVILDREDAFHKFWSDETRRKGALPSIKRFRFQLPSSSLKDTDAPNSGLSEPVLPGTLALSIPNPHAGELPTSNPLYKCRPYRYVYSLALRGLSTLMDCIVKTDLETREALFWSGPRGSQPGEPIFVPRPPTGSDGDGDGDGDAAEAPAREDDGVLLSVVLDGEKGTSYLLCLDAKTMKELGRAEADFAVGCGFHGTHVPAA